MIRLICRRTALFQYGVSGEKYSGRAGEHADRGSAQGNADILYVMPSHQFPLGTVMPLKQRLELLKWASEKEGRYLIEDDHDSEYRYKGKPIPSLQSIDHEEKVIYLGTFQKRIAPSLANQLHGSSVAFVKKISGIMQLLFHNRFEDSAGSIAGIHPGRILWQTFK